MKRDEAIIQMVDLALKEEVEGQYIIWATEEKRMAHLACDMTRTYLDHEDIGYSFAKYGLVIRIEHGAVIQFRAPQGPDTVYGSINVAVFWDDSRSRTYQIIEALMTTVHKNPRGQFHLVTTDR